MDELEMSIIRDKQWAVRMAAMASGTLTLLSILVLIQNAIDTYFTLFLVAFVQYAVLFIAFSKILIRKRMKLHAELYKDMLDKLEKGRG